MARGADEPEFAGASLSGTEVSVGGPDFPEGLVLGNMLVLAYREAGAEVDSRVGAGDWKATRRDLGADRIDAGIEYNGLTAGLIGLDNPPSDPAKLTSRIAGVDRSENGIVWLGRSSFNNTYGFVVAPELSSGNDFLDLDSVAYYMRANPEAVLCTLPPGNLNRGSLERFERLTDFTIPGSQLVEVQVNEVARSTSSGQCSFSEVSTTSGLIHAEGLVVVSSGDQVATNNASVTMREQVYEQAPEAFTSIAVTLLNSLDDETMRFLNSKVVIDGEDPKQVAHDYLVSVDLIEP